MLTRCGNLSSRLLIGTQSALELPVHPAKLPLARPSRVCLLRSHTNQRRWRQNRSSSQVPCVFFEPLHQTPFAGHTRSALPLLPVHHVQRMPQGPFPQSLSPRILSHKTDCIEPQPVSSLASWFAPSAPQMAMIGLCRGGLARSIRPPTPL